ncbi:MAG: ABC transporter permease [Acidobacteriota bacterium]
MRKPLITPDKISRLLSFLGPFLGLLLIILIFAMIPEVQDRFLRFSNLKSVTTQSVIVALCALGMTMIIISGGIDLSVGSSIALSSVVIAYAIKSGLNPFLSILLGILTGGIIGFGNGVLITSFKIVPFIVTLGMLGIARGIAKWIAGNQKIDAPLTWINQLMTKYPDPSWLLLSPGIWITLILAIFIALVLKHSVFGRHTFAIGSNEITARLCGIRVNKVKILIYTFSGFLTGLAGVMEFSRLTVGDPTVAIGIELDVIAAVVIGGGSLRGGEGSVLGSMIGVFIMAFLRNGSTMVGWPNYIQEIIIGSIIVIAVTIDQLRYRKEL